MCLSTGLRINKGEFDTITINLGTTAFELMPDSVKSRVNGRPREMELLTKRARQRNGVRISTLTGACFHGPGFDPWSRRPGIAIAAPVSKSDRYAPVRQRATEAI